jgi:hypothetical protein
MIDICTWDCIAQGPYPSVIELRFPDAGRLRIFAAVYGILNRSRIGSPCIS